MLGRQRAGVGRVRDFQKVYSAAPVCASPAAWTPSPPSDQAATTASSLILLLLSPTTRMALPRPFHFPPCSVRRLLPLA
ncbi:unnamed protein product [Linum trigynum]|uniref:Uncharacterized protein n=1 Tax=Linum trigynum TaxID=586398 RepID=A0AAV2FSS2_9ROSI